MNQNKILKGKTKFQKAMIELGEAIKKFNEKPDYVKKLSEKDLKYILKTIANNNKIKRAKKIKRDMFTLEKRGDFAYKSYKSINGAINVTIRRGGGELIVFTKAKNLIEYVMNATNRSPKGFRFSFVSKIQTYALEILENLYFANQIIVIKKDEQKRQKD